MSSAIPAIVEIGVSSEIEVSAAGISDTGCDASLRLIIFIGSSGISGYLNIT